MREVERSAASVDEAVQDALAELGLTADEADVEVLQEPGGGFLGLGRRQDAVVRVRARDRGPERGEAGPDEPGAAAADRAAPDEEVAEDVEEQAEIAADFVEGLLDAMDLPGELEINTVDGITYVDLWGPESADEMGVLIGRHGQTLDALQEITRSVVQQQLGERCRVVVDVEDYRKRRREQIVGRVRAVAKRVERSGRPESLDPMNALERKLVHDTIGALGGLETASEGEEPNRRVVIRPARSSVSRET